MGQQHYRATKKFPTPNKPRRYQSIQKRRMEETSQKQLLEEENRETEEIIAKSKKMSYLVR